MKAAALILAGGRGRRFGCPKAYAHLPDGRTFLETCWEKLREIGCDPVVATLPRGIEGNLPPGLQRHSVDPEDDMFSSIRLGLDRLLGHPEWKCVLILPVDHPLILPRTLHALTTARAQAAIATYHRHHGHPVMLSRRIAEKIIDGTLNGPTLREILRESAAVDIEVEDPGIRANCNTPDRLARALEEMSVSTPEMPQEE